MRKIFIPIFFIPVLMLSCHTNEKPVDLETLSKEFTTIQQNFKNQIKQGQTNKDFSALVTQKNSQYKKLLKKCEMMPVSDPGEILKGKIFLQLSKPDEAEKLINPLLNKKTKYLNEAKMVKTLSLILQEKINQAIKIFREIEPGVSRDYDFFSVCLFFSLKATDRNVSQEYATKLLNAPDLPPEFNMLKGRLHSVLAAFEYRSNRLEQAKVHLKKALEQTKNTLEKSIFQSRLSQLELIGNPPPAIRADIWINTPSLFLQNLKGKHVIIDFWAPWCEPCRTAIPDLIDAAQQYREKGLIIIGFTKLYGMYADEKERKNQVEKAEEINLIRQFVTRHGISYPVAISQEGEGFPQYHVSGIPAMVFINPGGIITQIHVGQSQAGELKKNIKEFLEK